MGRLTGESMRAALHGAVVFALVTPIALAHHSTSVYDLETVMVLEGVVTKYEWKNPHVYIFIETRGNGGDSLIWEIEASPPALMKRRGWSRDTLSPGDRITVRGMPARNPNRKMILGTSVRQEHGQELDMRGLAALSYAGDEQPGRTDSIAGTWLTLLDPGVATPFVLGPSTWPLTEAGRAAVTEFQESMNPGVECVSYTVPFLMVFPDMKTIEIGDEKVVIRSEFEGVERTIDMNASLYDGADFAHHGRAVGRWEGDVLVVYTVNFADHRMGNAFMLPSGAQKHLTERFQLHPDGMRLIYRFELDDPEYLETPVTGEVQWAYRPDLALSPEECDLENARRYLRD